MGYVGGKYEEIRTEMIMLVHYHTMYAIRIQSRLINADLRDIFGIECIGDVVRISRFRWSENVQRKPVEDWVKKIVTFEVDGNTIARSTYIGSHMWK